MISSQFARFAVAFAALSALVLVNSAAHAVVTSPYVGDLEAWFRGDSGVTITGSGISQWNDLSGNGNHATQGDDADRPVVGGSLNGHAYIDFEDGTDHMDLSPLVHPNGGNGMHIFMVTRTTDSGTGTVWLGENASVNSFIADAAGPNSLRAQLGTTGGTPEATVAGDPELFHITEFWFDGTSMFQLFYNSTPGAIQTYASAAFTIDNIAEYASSSAWRGQGEMAELLIYDRLLTDEEANNTGTYLAERYAITALNYDFVPPVPVPEPSSVLLLGLGTLLFSQNRRKGRANRN